MPFPSRPGVIAALLIICQAVLAAEQGWHGVPLRDYIDALRSQGLRIIYSSDLVRDEYRVQAQPRSRDPEAALREVLAPYGLTVTAGPADSLLITRAEAISSSVIVRVRDAVSDSGVAGARVALDGRETGVTDQNGRLVLDEVAAGPHRVTASADGYEEKATATFTARGPGEITVGVTLDPGPAPLPEIIVTSSHYDIRYQQAGSYTFLDRELTTKLPHLGDEALRTIARLPGATGGGLSSRHHVRGGLQNEQLFLLDGLRLYEPYHLKDFHSVTTIVPPGAIAGIDFFSAGYQARYGDRMSGVVDIALREPPEQTETELGLTFFHTSALSRGRFGGDDRGDWLVSGRRANLDLIVDIVNPKYGAPRYQDYMAHVGWDLGGHTYLSGNAVFSSDKISLAQTDGSERASARYKNDILWLKAESQWNDRLESSTILSATSIDNRRSGVADEPGVIEGFVEDESEFRSLALKQDWIYDLSDRWLLRTGFEIKRLEAEYSYSASLQIAPPFDAILDNRATEMRTIDVSPRGSQYAGYTEIRWRPVDSLTLDLGLRWDQQTYTDMDDEQVSPRVNLLWRMGSDSDLRLAYGEYYQAQEINELQVSDGLTTYHPAQRARHLVASLTHGFAAGPELRVEAYQKKYYGLMPRFENAFNPLVLIPELQIDRVRIDADRATAEGLEVTLSSGDPGDLSWWASYAWSRSVDRILGEAVRRSWDQRHSISAGVSRDWNRWSMSAAAVVRSGWPKTVLEAQTVRNPEGAASLVATVEPYNSRRHDAFSSLDIRVSRRFELSKGELTAFLEVTNLLNRQNPCCTEYSVAFDENGDPSLVSEEGTWLPLIPSLGVLWRF